MLTRVHGIAYMDVTQTAVINIGGQAWCIDADGMVMAGGSVVIEVAGNVAMDVAGISVGFDAVADKSALRFEELNRIDSALFA